MRRFAPAAAIALLSLTACGGSTDEGLPDALQRAQPTVQAPATYTPLESPPMEFRTVTGPNYEISVPGGWDERVDERSTATVKPVAYLDPTAPAGSVVFVGIVVDSPADSDVLAQSVVLVGDKRTSGAQEVTRESLTWPNAERAVRVTWQESAGGSTVPLQYEQLMVQVRQGLIVNAIAAAPVEQFASAQLETILRTLVVTP